MGVVYKARDTQLDRIVAVKFLPLGRHTDEEGRLRFVREARAASALEHPNICTFYEMGETPDQQLFIVMAYYDGNSVKERIRECPLPIDECVRTAMSVAEGLAQAHGRGIIHRDIKSENIRVTADGIVKIMDFGLASIKGESRLTRTGATMGTAPYMSPEQARGEDLDSRTDVWSLGIVLYEMVAGRLPFNSEYNEAIVYSILNEDPEPLTSLRSDVPIELERIVSKAMNKGRGSRYQHADELLADLRTLREASKQGGLPARPGARRKTIAGSTAAVLIVAVLAAAGLILLLMKPAGPPKKSIAVLPFTNMSRDGENEYFSDGMTEDIITDLAKIGKFKVISRTSVMRYKNTSKGVRDIGKELGVATVLEGSVRRSGNQVRIVAQLIDALNDEHLWAETYDKELTQIFAIQSDVAQQITKALNETLSSTQKGQLEKAATGSVDAYNLYLEGRFYWNKRTGDNLKKAIDYFNQAVEKDSAYALAYAGLASAYVLSPFYAGLPPSEFMGKAKTAAMKAMEIDETLSEAHAVLGYIKGNFEWNWADAEKEYKRAIEFNPGYPTAYQWYSVCLSSVGRLEEALTTIKKAQELDPLSLIINETVADRYYLLKRYDEAIAQYRKTLELDSNFSGAHAGLALVYQEEGRFQEALAECRTVRALAGNSPVRLEYLGFINAMAGRKEEAKQVLDELLAFSRQGYSLSVQIAAVYSSLNERDSAFQWLGHAYNEHNELLRTLKVARVWDNLRPDPRFGVFVKRVGLDS